MSTAISPGRRSIPRSIPSTTRPAAGTGSSGSTRTRASTRSSIDARKTNDEGKRKALFDEFQKIVDETVPSIIAYSAAHVNGVRKKVEEFHSTPMQWLELKDVTLEALS